jgi:hypothetical protein
MGPFLRQLDTIQNRAIRLICSLITASLAPLASRGNVGAFCLLYRYFVGIDTCSFEIKTILPALKIFTRNTRQAARNHPYFLALDKISSNYLENSFIVRTFKLWNLLPLEVFPKADGAYKYTLQIFKSNVNKVCSH